MNNIKKNHQTILNLIKKYQEKLPLLVIIVSLFFSIFIFSHFGVPYDEPISMERGEINYNFVVNYDRALYDFDGRFHGAWLEILLFILGEKVLGFENYSREMILFRRFFLSTLFFLSSYIIYLISLKINKDKVPALFSQVAYILSPVIFSHAYYNTKDIGFLIFFLFAMYFILEGVGKRVGYRLIIIQAVTTGMAIALRQQGVILIAFNIFVLLMAHVKSKDISASAVFSFVKLLFSYLLFSYLTFVFLTPFIWEHPFYRFIEVFSVMSRYEIWDNTILYLGKTDHVDLLPWHYLPVWILISTPIFYTVFALIGTISSIFNTTKDVLKKWHKLSNKSITNIILLGWLIGPIVIIIILDSIVYNSWRHVFFIYPAFILFFGIGLKNFSKTVLNKKSPNFSKFFYLAVTSLMMFIFATMVYTHPLQNLYLNPVATVMKGDRHLFEADYWGISSYEALTYILNNDSRKEKIKISGNYNPVYFNEMILTDNQKSRVNFIYRDSTDKDKVFKVDYFIAIAAYRNNFEYEGFVVIHERRINGVLAYKIFKKV